MDRGGDRVQSFLWDQTQQGDTYVPGKDSLQSRAKRVKRTIQDIQEQLPSFSSAQEQTQGGQWSASWKVTNNTVGQSYTHYNSIKADLNGIGQQF